MEYGAGVAPFVRMIQTVCKEGMAGLSLAKVRRLSALGGFTLLTLTNALETFVVSTQINGQDRLMTNKILSRKIKSVMGYTIACSTKLLNHVMQETIIDLMVSK